MFCSRSLFCIHLYSFVREHSDHYQIIGESEFLVKGPSIGSLNDADLDS